MTVADQAYVPTWKIELCAIGDDITDPDNWFELNCESAELVDGHPDLTKELNVSLPRDFDYAYDDFDAFADNLLQRGTNIRVTLTEDNFVSGTRDELKLLGRIWNASISHRAGDAKLDITAFDWLAKARAIGMNISRQTRVLLYKVTWEEDTAGVWDASDPDYLVNIPVGLLDGDPAGAGVNDFMPEGLVKITSRRNSATEEHLAEVINYTPDTFQYSSARKQVYFKVNRGAVVTLMVTTSSVRVNSVKGFDTGDVVEIVDPLGAVVTRTIGAVSITNSRITFTAPVVGIDQGWLIRFSDRTWTLEAYYYDPTDLTNTVQKVLEFIASGLPWSYTGGLGFDSGALDFDAIFGLDGVTELVVRTILRDKPEGNIQQIIESLREAGLIGSNYMIEHNAAANEIQGRTLVQNDAGALTPKFGVIETEEQYTLESQAGRVECYSLATSPTNLILGATVTKNISDGVAAYNERGDEYSTIDGRGATAWEIWLQAGVGLDYPPVDSPVDFLTYDIGEAREFRRILFRGTNPVAADGKDMKMYLIQRRPRWTISASLDPISAANPGIPVARDAINFEVDPTNIGRNGGWDIDVQADNIHKARYFAIRLEQDCLYRATDKISITGTVIRESFAGVGEFAVLDDGRFKYPPGPFEGQYPSAQLVRHGSTVTIVTDGTHITLADASWLTHGDWLQIMHAGVPVHVLVSNVVGNAVTLATAVTASIADEVGQTGRWKLRLAGTWEDFLYPQLYDKVVGTTDWLEILNDERPADIADAEGLAVERLVELIKIQRDYKMQYLYDKRIGKGTTVRAYAGLKPWLATKLRYILSSPASNQPGVVVSAEGTDYDLEPS